MEMKYVVPDMAQFLELLNLQAKATMFLRDKDNRRFFARRSYNLYSDVREGKMLW